MPWCPKCRYEYREGVTVCGRCNEQLVDKLEEEPAAESKTDKLLEVKEEWVFLMNARDEIEADSMEAMLDSFGIPVVRTHNDYSTLAHVYTGKSNFGADILVPASRLEEARDILNSGEDIELEDSAYEAQEEQDFDIEELGVKEDESGDRVVYHKNRRPVAWLLLAIIAALVVIAGVLGPSGILSRLFGR